MTPSPGAAPERLKAGHAALLAAGAAALAMVLTFGLSMTGLLGPDEPRYASIARQMAETGDWLTPRLWTEPPAAPGLEPWFEKPPLLYWLGGLGLKAGLGPELGVRLPVAMVSLAFLGLFWWAVRRLEGTVTASLAAMILATSAGWFAYSIVGVTDLGLAASFNAGFLCALLRLAGGGRRWAVAAGAAFGFALLAKGLVAGVLALPLVWFARRDRIGFVLAGAAAVAVAAPWYGGMVALHGQAFVDEFFLKHHFSRFSSTALQHVQPFWFYIPVLLGGVFPWLPLTFGLVPRVWRTPSRKAFAATLLFGFVFFSASTNKLPGYLLPLFPSLAVLMAAGLQEAREAKRALPLSALLLALAPVAATTLPDALLVGIRRAQWGSLPWEYVAAALPVAGVAWWLENRGLRVAGTAVVAGGALIGFAYIQLSAFPVLDQVVSARGLARRIEHRADRICVERLHRAMRYGLNYYMGKPLPLCEAEPRPVVLDQAPGGLPYLRPRNGD